MSSLQNNYRERLIEKLKQQIQINSDNAAAKEELNRLLQPAGGVSAENAEKVKADTTKKKE